MKTDLVLLGAHINIASQTSRRWLVVLLYAGFAALVIAWLSPFGSSGGGTLAVLAILCLLRFLGGRTYDSGLLPPVDVVDERERNRRDRAHFLAYSYLDLAFIPALLATGFKIHPQFAVTHPALQAFCDRLPFGFLFAAAIVYYTLPQTILLWTEPDMEQEPA
jgi:hypothetical protein